jgi:hypothetical protein
MLPHVFSLMMRLRPCCAHINLQFLVLIPPNTIGFQTRQRCTICFLYNIIMPSFIRKFYPGVWCQFIMWRFGKYPVRRARSQLHHAAPIDLDVVWTR